LFFTCCNFFRSISLKNQITAAQIDLPFSASPRRKKDSGTRQQKTKRNKKETGKEKKKLRKKRKGEKT
jgi:hypothetical protein